VRGGRGTALIGYSAQPERAGGAEIGAVEGAVNT
jgi:hypothetical protein